MNKFIATGTLVKKMEVRHVGDNGLWEVQDFVLSFRYGTRYDQFRVFQAVKGAIGQLGKIDLGKEVAVTFLAKGRHTGGEKYFNLDECVDISLILGSEWE